MCLFFSFVKMAEKAFGRVTPFSMFVNVQLNNFWSIIFKIEELGYLLAEFHLEWSSYTWEPDFCIFPTWERNFRSKHGLEPAVSNRGYHGNSAFSDPNMAVFVHLPRYSNSMQKNGGLRILISNFSRFSRRLVLNCLHETNRIYKGYE